MIQPSSHDFFADMYPRTLHGSYFEREGLYLATGNGPEHLATPPRESTCPARTLLDAEPVRALRHQSPK